MCPNSNNERNFLCGLMTVAVPVAATTLMACSTAALVIANAPPIIVTYHAPHIIADSISNAPHIIVDSISNAPPIIVVENIFESIIIDIISATLLS
eukprot:Em0001g1756a